MATTSQITVIVIDNATIYYCTHTHIYIYSIRTELKVDVRNTCFEGVRWKETASNRA